MRIAVVEDNTPLAQGIAYAFRDDGHSVDVFADGADALPALLSGEPDAIVLDVNLPGLDGLCLLRRLRAAGRTAPVLLLTAQGGLDDRIAGLDAGADDYLVKPFEMGELAARMRALLRRRGVQLSATISVGRLTLDINTREIRAGDTRLPVPRRETALFEALALSSGRLVARERLIEHVYGTGSDIEAGTLDSHLSRLRARIAPHGAAIRTVRGLGYLLEET